MGLSPRLVEGSRGLVGKNKPTSSLIQDPEKAGLWRSFLGQRDQRAISSRPFWFCGSLEDHPFSESLPKPWRLASLAGRDLEVSESRFNVDCRAQLVFGIGQVLSVLQDPSPAGVSLLGPPARCPFTPTWVGSSPTKIDETEEVGTLVLTSLLEDLVFPPKAHRSFFSPFGVPVLNPTFESRPQKVNLSILRSFGQLRCSFLICAVVFVSRARSVGCLSQGLALFVLW